MRVSNPFIMAAEQPSSGVAEMSENAQFLEQTPFSTHLSGSNFIMLSASNNIIPTSEDTIIIGIARCISLFTPVGKVYVQLVPR